MYLPSYIKLWENCENRPRKCILSCYTLQNNNDIAHNIVNILFYFTSRYLYYIIFMYKRFFFFVYLQASSETNDSIELPGSRRSTAGSSGQLLQKHNTILRGEGNGDGWWLDGDVGVGLRDAAIRLFQYYYGIMISCLYYGLCVYMYRRCIILLLYYIIYTEG